MYGMGSPAMRGSAYAAFGKRLLDMFLSLAALAVLSPVLLATAILVRIRLGSPVLFRQVRPGLGGKLFTLWKFRTMRDERDETGRPLPDGERLTPFGKALRSTSLDELPELWNVLRGDMSIVGPRPLLVQYLPRYSPRQARRHEVRPGITGWAQVNGRNALSWDEKFEMDVWYVEHVSFALDATIIARTVIKIVQREGISTDGHATAPEFLGDGGTAGPFLPPAEAGKEGGGEAGKLP